MKILWGVIALLITSIIGLTYANGGPLFRVQSVNDFYAKVKPRPGRQLNLSVVLFYEAQLGKKVQLEGLDKDEREQVKQRAKELRSLVKEQVATFKQARFGVSQTAFLMVDIGHKDLEELAKEFGVHSMPEVHLFRKGKPYMVDGKPAVLVGNFLKDELLGEPEIVAFIEKHFGSDIEAIIKEIDKQWQELRQAFASAPVVYGPYWGWGGWGPYYGGPYYGSYYAGRGWRMCAGC